MTPQLFNCQDKPVNSCQEMRMLFLPGVFMNSLTLGLKVVACSKHTKPPDRDENQTGSQVLSGNRTSGTSDVKRQTQSLSRRQISKDTATNPLYRTSWDSHFLEIYNKAVVIGESFYRPLRPCLMSWFSLVGLVSHCACDLYPHFMSYFLYFHICASVCEREALCNRVFFFF